MLLYYFRHGDPIYNPDSLTPLGERQAEALAKRVATYGLDKIYMSSSNRAQLTAKPTCEVLKLEPEVLDWCLERYAFNDLSFVGPEGRRRWYFADDEMRKKFVSREMTELGDKWYDHPMFDGTTVKSGYQRIQNETYNFLAGLGYKFAKESGTYECTEPNEKRIGLFAHQGFGIAFLSVILNIPYPSFSTKFDLGHSSMTVIEFKNSCDCIVPRVISCSNDSHLYKEGLPTKFNNEIYI